MFTYYNILHYYYFTYTHPEIDFSMQIFYNDQSFHVALQFLRKFAAFT